MIFCRKRQDGYVVRVYFQGFDFNGNNGILIRLYNSSSEKQEITLKFDSKTSNISLLPFEVKTFISDNSAIIETDMIM